MPIKPVTGAAEAEAQGCQHLPPAKSRTDTKNWPKDNGQLALSHGQAEAHSLSVKRSLYIKGDSVYQSLE